MKRLLLLAAFGLATATALPVQAADLLTATPAKEDTIQVKLANGALMTLVLKNTNQLKSFRNYSLDSLIRTLDKYIVEAEKMEAKSGSAEEYTVTFKPAKETNNHRNPEKVSITFKNSESAGIGKTERKGVHIDVEYDEKHDKKTIVIGSYPKEKSDTASTKTSKKIAKANRRSWGGMNLDLGFNTLLNKNGNMLDVAGLKPWGSRYVSINPYYMFRVGEAKSPLHLRTGLDFSFNNYMFDRNYVLRDTEATGTSYTTLEKDPRIGDNSNLDKSKLATSSVNLPLMVLLDFDNSKGKSMFRVGAGGFVGYRMGAHTKVKYSNNNRSEKEKDRGNFNLEDLQYGLKATIGFRSVDLFANYNLNTLFKDNRGPNANTLSFGITL